MKRIWEMLVCVILLVIPTGIVGEAGAQVLPVCPPPARWVPGGGGVMCQCPDGRVLSMGQTCGGRERLQSQPRQVGDLCGDGHSCPVGTRCSWKPGKCVPDGRIDCGSYHCPPKSKCASGNQCIAFDAIDCRNGQSCPAGYFCVNGGCAQEIDHAARMLSALWGLAVTLAPLCVAIISLCALYLIFGRLRRFYW
jgi:hypothetical protein